MAGTLTAIVLVFLTMHLRAFVAYGSFAALFDLPAPAGVTPAQLFQAVFLMKLGLSIAFVLLFRVAREVWVNRWLHYALIWWVMFVLMEIGQAMLPNYSWMEALAGVISETLYCPVAAFITAKLLGNVNKQANRLRKPGDE